MTTPKSTPAKSQPIPEPKCKPCDDFFGRLKRAGEGVAKAMEEARRKTK